MTEENIKSKERSSHPNKGVDLKKGDTVLVGASFFRRDPTFARKYQGTTGTIISFICEGLCQVTLVKVSLDKGKVEALFWPEEITKVLF